MTEKRRLLLLSSTVVYGSEMLQFAANFVREFFNNHPLTMPAAVTLAKRMDKPNNPRGVFRKQKSHVKKILFIPYATVEYDDYVKRVREAFKKNNLDFQIIGIHELNDPVKAVKEAEAIYIGGGNTFLLLKTLYEVKIVELIRDRVMKDGMPYMGSSAGSNVATINICTTNDMPIVYVPTLTAINLVPFNINPHYLDPDPNSPHMGESRQKRIEEYLQMPECYPVLGLREGSLINVEGNKALLIGKPKARLFMKGKDPVEYPEGSDMSFLLKK